MNYFLDGAAKTSPCQHPVHFHLVSLYLRVSRFLQTPEVSQTNLKQWIDFVFIQRYFLLVLKRASCRICLATEKSRVITTYQIDKRTILYGNLMEVMDDGRRQL